MENQNTQQRQPHMLVECEVMDYRHFSGKGENPRASTLVKGLMTFSDGFRSSVEFFVDGHHHFNQPFWKIGLRLGADWKYRLGVQVISFTPIQKRQAA